MLDLQSDSQSTQQQQGAAQAVNGQSVPLDTPAVELSGEAAALFATLQERIGKRPMSASGCWSASR